ncbi:MAG: RNA pyrophosphohydrolase [Gammaproteobacteria bacterium]|jgi:putative (di)nucleoside polyphosphate hydrolase|nr:RNA pyrophosphohydrolase [Chromatiales bacterium]MDP7093594.1 RNA pyrophosphohydrolase [Gammaproteobacteria bacterium]MDP7270427.1 RNA pyrophosphohydrolase [Gammaproteobacteria bacterium]MDP7418998.1 RNA pyrophosphohydrolase [Gammaproteobacteria bacterium]HJP05306.1 RNA pyrophosphohydrolase [Gammaproteobacteria bacterium]
MDHYDSNGFRSNVGIILTRDDANLLLGGRAGQAGWQFPQGGIQIDETPLEAMYRELAEEIGLGKDDVEVLGETTGWLHYRLPERFIRRDSKPLCVGQKQRWFLLKLLGSDNKLHFDNTDLPEFDRWRWVDYWQPVKEVIYFKRQVYVTALEELAPLLFSENAPPQPRWWPDDWLTEPERAPD